jgi:hypothetical protein
VPNFLNLTLVPGNQIIHPGRYYGLFRHWDGVQTYKESEVPLMYEDMDLASADMISSLDHELQAIKMALVEAYPSLNLGRIMPIRRRIVDTYGTAVGDSRSVQSTFRTNQAYAGISTPMEDSGRTCADGERLMLPATNSRVFWEDIPYGLVVLICIAELCHVRVPRMVEIVAWHQQWMDRVFVDGDGYLIKGNLQGTGAPYAFGVETLEQLVAPNLPGPTSVAATPSLGGRAAGVPVEAASRTTRVSKPTVGTSLARPVSSIDAASVAKSSESRSGSEPGSVLSPVASAGSVAGLGSSQLHRIASAVATLLVSNSDSFLPVGLAELDQEDTVGLSLSGDAPLTASGSPADMVPPSPAATSTPPTFRVRGRA